MQPKFSLQMRSYIMTFHIFLASYFLLYLLGHKFLLEEEIILLLSYSELFSVNIHLWMAQS